MKKLITRISIYAAIGIVALPLTVITHELGHYFAYLIFGASNVQLHSVSVSADKEALGNIQLAIAAIVGPIISYLTLGLALFFTRKNYVPFWVIIGLAAPFGRIVNAVYIYFRALGYNPNPNFDEFNFSRNVNIEPLILAIPTMIAFFFVVWIFLGKAWRVGKIAELAAVIFSVACGLVVWSLVGGMILP